MPPKTTTWSLEPHTQGKHLVLKHYMDAWLPIMASSNSNILFIDAFAGPGEYSDGEKGSPLIALQALTEHNASGRMRGKVHFLFIEKNAKRAQYLKGVLKERELSMRNICTYEVLNSTFDDKLTEVLDGIEKQNKNLAPSFVMIDPFGVSDTPMSTIGRILANPKSEVYVSFMYESINRFKEHPNFEQHLDELFGCPEWRGGIDILEGRKRADFFFRLYRSQLKRNGAKYVHHFELYEGRQLVYAIFFGTSNSKGSDKMKQAIWKVAPFGDFRFRGGQAAQLDFGSKIVDTTPLRQSLHSEFDGRGWVRIRDVTEYVMSDKTEFHTGHMKDRTLKPMEDNGEIQVKDGSRKRSRSYPEGTMLRFIPKLI